MPSQIEKAYLAGFLDGDGSIYAQLKPNHMYRFGFQIASYAVFFQSQKNQKGFQRICSLIGSGYLRARKDGILEYIIGRTDALRDLLVMVQPFVILKRQQVDLMLEVLKKKECMNDAKDFQKLANLVEKFRALNYSKKRTRHMITP